jgi:hypothetical protein
MEILVIHPKDSSTDFLKAIYSHMECTVIDTNVSNSAVVKAIEEHDRIIMLGHGCDQGLIAFKNRLIVNSKHVYLLRDKECVGIWCNADKFFEKYNLGGIYTGMIISEIDEAIDYCVRISGISDIKDSNILFAKAMKMLVYGYSVSDALQFYSINNPVVQFNRQNIFKEEKAIYCDICGEFCGRGMGSGYKYMLHHTIGCNEAKRY